MHSYNIYNKHTRSVRISLNKATVIWELLYQGHTTRHNVPRNYFAFLNEWSHSQQSMNSTELFPSKWKHKQLAQLFDENAN